MDAIFEMSRLNIIAESVTNIPIPLGPFLPYFHFGCPRIDVIFEKSDEVIVIYSRRPNLFVQFWRCLQIVYIVQFVTFFDYENFV